MLVSLSLAALMVVSAASGSLALWRQRVGVAAEIEVAATHFAAGTPTADDSPLPQPWSDNWTLPTDGLWSTIDPLAPGDQAVRAVQLDGVSPGNRGMSYWLARVEVDDPAGNGYLAAFLSVQLYAIGDPARCGTALPPVDPLYDGPLTEAAIAPQILSEPGGGSRTAYLCVRLTVDQDLPTRYRNTATVRGNADDGGTDRAAASASAEWNALIRLTPEALSPTVRFVFDSDTFREEDTS